MCILRDCDKNDYVFGISTFYNIIDVFIPNWPWLVCTHNANRQSRCKYVRQFYLFYFNR